MLPHFMGDFGELMAWLRGWPAPEQVWVGAFPAAKRLLDNSRDLNR